MWRWLDHLDDVGTGEALLLFGSFDSYAFTRKRASDKDDATIVKSSDGLAPGSYSFGLDLCHLARLPGTVTPTPGVLH